MPFGMFWQSRPKCVIIHTCAGVASLYISWVGASGSSAPHLYPFCLRKTSSPLRDPPSAGAGGGPITGSPPIICDSYWGVDHSAAHAKHTALQQEAMPAAAVKHGALHAIGDKVCAGIFGKRGGRGRVCLAMVEQGPHRPPTPPAIYPLNTRRRSHSCS